MRVYVSGSIHDMDRCRSVIRMLKRGGHTITHDWTKYKGPQDNCEEAQRQLAGVRAARVLVLLEYPKGRAANMEFGAAVADEKPCIVVPHRTLKPSMWYSFPWVHLASPYGLLHDLPLVAHA